MANNYQAFSEVIENITSSEKKWILSYLQGYEDRGTDEEDLKQWAKDRGLDPEDMYEIDAWPGFGWSIEKDGGLWLHGDDCFNLDNLITFVQTFFEKFRPLGIFKMTYATWCDRPRVGEFGGGWAVVTAYESRFGNAYSAADEAAKHVASRIELETQAKRAAVQIPD